MKEKIIQLKIGKKVVEYIYSDDGHTYGIIAKDVLVTELLPPVQQTSRVVWVMGDGKVLRPKDLNRNCAYVGR